MNELNGERHERLVASPGDAVWWHDGLLLEAAHFQQLCQRQEQLLTYHLRSAMPYAWGVRQMQIADKYLSNNLFSITSLEAIMPDGLVVSHQDGADKLEFPLTADLHAQLAASRQSATICLAVPVNDTIADADDSARYVPVATASGASGVAHVRPRLRLALASDLEKQANDAVLPLARVSVRLGKFELVHFLPPLLDIDVAPSWVDGSSLYEQSMELVNRMQRAANYLGEASRKRPVGIEDQLRRIELHQRLACVGNGIPVLRGVLSLPGVSPLALYLAWCGALGSLSALDDSGELAHSSFPGYRHDELSACFTLLFARVQMLLAMADRPFVELPFERPSPQQFAHAFKQGQRYGWPTFDLDAGADATALGAVLLIGIRGLSEEKAAQWLSGAVIAAADHQETCRKERRMGAPRSLVQPNGRLSLLEGKAIGQERKVDVRGMATPDIVLFAIDTDPRTGHMPDIVLQNSASEGPSEVVLFVHKATA